MPPFVPHVRSVCSVFRRFGLLAVLAGLAWPAASKAQGSCTTISGGVTTCSSTDVIKTAQNSSGTMPETPSSNYPDEIDVPYSGTLQSISVTLNNINTSQDTGQEGLFWTQVVLVSPGGKALVILGGAGQPTDVLGSSSNLASGLTMNIADGNASMPYQPPSGGGNDLPSSGTANYEPTDILDNEGQGGGNQPILPGYSSTYPLSSSNWAQPDGSATLTGIFRGVPAAGEWRLFLADWSGDAVIINGWSMTLTIDQSQVSTTTTVSSSSNPVVATSGGTSVTYTALVENGTTPVTDSGATVAFYANGSSTPISGCSAQAVSTSTGKATCAVTLTAGSAAQCESTTRPTFPIVCQGGKTDITATYSGVNNVGGDYGSSTSNAYVQWVGGTITNPATNQYCNTNPLYVPTDASATDYPSYVTVSSYSSSTVYSASVQLQGISTSDGVFGQFLLVSPDGAHNLAFLDHSFELGATSSMNLDFNDSAGVYPGGSGSPSNGTSCTEANGDSAYCWEAYTYVSDSFTSADAGLPNTIPSLPGTINYAGTSSTNEFATKFDGATADGNWALYVNNGNGAETTTLANGWCITLTPSLAQTTTTVTASPNPALTNQSVTYTATVKSGGNPITSGGSVQFLDNGSNPAGTAENISVGSGDTASFSSSSLYDSINDANSSTVKLYEGDHTITATYSGSSTDDPSSGTVLERINNAATFSAGTGGTYNACNSGGIYLNQGNQGALTPNPSIISVANMPGTVSAVNLTLKSFFTYNSGETNDLESLVEGPTGKTLDFFSGVSSSSALSSGDYIFKDGGASPGGNFGPSTYEAASELGSDSFISGYYTAPSSITYAQPKGTGTFQSQFQNTNPNGNWALFFNMNTGQSTIGATSGWCLNFTENAVTINPTLSHNGTGTGGDFVQGETNAPITVNIAVGSSTGPTGDVLGTSPLTVVENLPSGLTFPATLSTSSGWSCTENTSTKATCTDDSTIAAGSSYPTLTLDVNVSTGASGTLSNSVTISGAGVSSTPANDSINIDAATTTAASAATTTFSTSAQNITLSAVVENNGVPIDGGTVTFDVMNGSTLIGTGATSGAVSGGNASVSYSLPANTAAGTYTIDATYNGNATYEISNDSATLTINAVTPTFTWGPPTTIIQGTASTNILNASVSCTLCGGVTYTDTPNGGSATSLSDTSTLAAGSYTITANFTATSGNYSSTSSSKSLTVSGQSVWVLNGGGGAAELAGNGYAITSSADGGLSKGVAIDGSGNVWTIGSGSTLLEDMGQTGISQHAVSSGGGLDAPSALAVDGNSDVWVANSGNNSVSLYSSAGAALSPSTGYTDSSLASPSGVAVDVSGSVWIANQGNNSVTRILGAAAPVAPLSTAAKNNTTGAKP